MPAQSAAGLVGRAPSPSCARVPAGTGYSRLRGLSAHQHEGRVRAALRHQVHQRGGLAALGPFALHHRHAGAVCTDTQPVDCTANKSRHSAMRTNGRRAALIRLLDRLRSGVSDPAVRCAAYRLAAGSVLNGFGLYVRKRARRDELPPHGGAVGWPARTEVAEARRGGRGLERREAGAAPYLTNTTTRMRRGPTRQKTVVSARRVTCTIGHTHERCRQGTCSECAGTRGANLAPTVVSKGAADSTVAGQNEVLLRGLDAHHCPRRQGARTHTRMHARTHPGATCPL